MPRRRPRGSTRCWRRLPGGALAPPRRLTPSRSRRAQDEALAPPPHALTRRSRSHIEHAPTTSHAIAPVIDVVAEYVAHPLPHINSRAEPECFYRRCGAESIAIWRLREGHRVNNAQTRAHDLLVETISLCPMAHRDSRLKWTPRRTWTRLCKRLAQDRTGANFNPVGLAAGSHWYSHLFGGATHQGAPVVPGDHSPSLKRRQC